MTYRDVLLAVEPFVGKITEVICGGARGADRLGRRWAIDRGIPIRDMPADWNNPSSPTFNVTLGYDPVAGHRRNAEMATYGQLLIAIWDGKSTGTANMIKEAQLLGLEVHIHRV